MNEPTRGKNLGVGELCAACPWRTTNHGRRHPDGWYTKANLKRLWAGLRTGEATGMTCHPTDPVNPAPTGRPLAKAPDGADFYECAGAHAIRQVEIRLLEECDSFEEYRRRSQAPPMTQEGLYIYVMDTQTSGPGAGILGLSPTQIPDVTHLAPEVSRP